MENMMPDVFSNIIAGFLGAAIALPAAAAILWAIQRWRLRGLKSWLSIAILYALVYALLMSLAKHLNGIALREGFTTGATGVLFVILGAKLLRSDLRR